MTNGSATLKRYNVEALKPHAGTLSRNNHAGRVRPTNPKRLLHSWVCTRFNRNEREDCPADDESQRAGILHAPICGERRRAQAGAATLAASEIFAGSTAGQTSFWVKSRARSWASRWEVGKNGGALVSVWRQPTGSGRRSGLVRGATAR